MIQIDLSEAFAYMNNVVAKLEDKQSFYDRAGTLSVELVRTRILSTKKGPDGVKWAKHKEPMDHGLLYNTGSLYKSIGKKISVSGVEINAGVDYAKYLQGGTKNMPARPFMGFGAKDKKAVMAEFARWVDEAIK